MNSYGSLLIPLMNENIPEELKLFISRKIGNNVWTLEDMLTYAKGEISAKERCNFYNPSKPSGSHSNNFTASNLFADTNNSNITCVYCKNNHTSSKCKNAANVPARISLLRKQPRCFICLRSRHISRKCSSSYICRKCGKKHHISICNTVPTEEENKQTTLHTETVNPIINVILQTSRGFISNVDSKTKGVNCCLLFDSGSQRTFITNELRSKLNFKTIRKEKIIIKTFGKMNIELQILDAVKFKVACKHDRHHVYVEALCVPNICSPLTQQNINSVKGFIFLDFFGLKILATKIQKLLYIVLPVLF